MVYTTLIFDIFFLLEVAAILNFSLCFKFPIGVSVAFTWNYWCQSNTHLYPTYHLDGKKPHEYQNPRFFEWPWNYGVAVKTDILHELLIINRKKTSLYSLPQYKYYVSCNLKFLKLL